MSNKFNDLLKNLASNPKRLFLIDSLGALVTACLTGLVLTRFEAVFGIPPKVLYKLAVVAIIYAVYSISCFCFIKTNWKPFLTAIAIANSIYIFITIGLVFFFYPQVSVLGLFYFLGELTIIASLVFIELKTVFQSE